MIGETVSHYRVIQKLGGGGMGVVYEAEDLRLHRKVALKFLPDDATPDAAALERFRREAEAASALNHPHICTIYDIGEHDGRPFIVMERLEGETLSGMRRLPLDRVLTIGSEVADALAAAHAAGIIHRDVKPANIFITTRGDAKLLDFGLARLDKTVGIDSETDIQLTNPGSTVGTVAYMSPEQARGDALDARTDLFSLGVVLYELATGVTPFEGETAATIAAAILMQPVTPPSEVNHSLTPEFDRVILGALEKDRDLRVQSAAELRAQLRRLRRDSSAPTMAAAKKPAQRFWPVTIAAVVIVIAAAAGFLLMRRNAPPVATGGKRLAVLPFENLGAAQDNYFADGMTDEVRGKLASLRGLEVIARASSDQYKNSRKPLPQIASELGVPYLLTGTIRWQKSGQTSRVRLSPELVELSSNSAPVTRWQDEYDADLTDVFAVQAKIASDVADALKVKLVAGEQQQIQQRPTSNIEAYDAYLKGVEAFSRGFMMGPMRDSQPQFERAVALDPNFALAWAWLSLNKSIQYAGRREPDMAEGARIAADRAMTLAPQLPKAYMARGFYERATGNTAGALDVFRRGLQIAPDDPDLLRNVGYAEEELGDLQSATVNLQRAASLDPRSWGNQLGMSRLFLFLHRPREARDAADRGLAITANATLFESKLWSFAEEGDIAAVRATIAAPPKGIEIDQVLADFSMGLTGWALSKEQRQTLLHLPAALFDDEVWWMCVHADALWTDGNIAEAKSNATKAVQRFDELIRAKPAEAAFYGGRAYMLAILGQKDEATASATKALSMPVNANDRGVIMYWQSRTFAIIGDQARTTDLIKQTLRAQTYLTPALLRVDPHFASLRGNPEFQKLIAGQ